MVSRASLVAVASAVALVLSACTPAASPAPSGTSGSASPTGVSASPTPTETWSAEQSEALRAVDAYSAAGLRIGTNPADFTEKQMKATMAKVAGPEVVKANVGSYMNLRKRGFRYDGAVAVLWTDATRASSNALGTYIVVTRCIDQRGLRAVDRNGDVVPESVLGNKIPEFNLREYQVLKPEGAAVFRVFGISGPPGKCES